MKRDNTEEYFLGSLSEKDKILVLNYKFTPLKVKIDTGADISVISRNTHHNLRDKPPQSEVDGNFRSPGGKVLKENSRYSQHI